MSWVIGFYATIIRGRAIYLTTRIQLADGWDLIHHSCLN